MLRPSNYSTTDCDRRPDMPGKSGVVAAFDRRRDTVVASLIPSGPMIWYRSVHVAARNCLMAWVRLTTTTNRVSASDATKVAFQHPNCPRFEYPLHHYLLPVIAKLVSCLPSIFQLIHDVTALLPPHFLLANEFTANNRNVSVEVTLKVP